MLRLPAESISIFGNFCLTWFFDLLWDNFKVSKLNKSRSVHFCKHTCTFTTANDTIVLFSWSVVFSTFLLGLLQTFHRILSPGFTAWH